METTSVNPRPYTGGDVVSSLAPGQKIARFELVALIGRGGMGEVWEACDRERNERVALKLIREARSSEALRRRFSREVKAASKVQHPSVVKVYDIIETEEGEPVMVMELLEGESLAERLHREKDLPVETVAGIMLPVVSAVGSAHAHGIVHRDLKPENIFLVRADDGGLEVRVLDFGIAKLVADEDHAETTAGLTTTGSILGTPCYMAPEQVFGEKDIDHRVDIWAIGIILYQMLTGILPTKADNVGQVLKIVVTRGIWPLGEAAPDLPRELSAIVDRMLSKEREERPTDLREVRAVLAEFAGEEAPSFGPPISERPPLEAENLPRTPAPVSGDTTVNPLADTAAVASGESPSSAPNQEEPARRPWPWLAVAAVALVALGTQFGGDEASPTETGVTHADPGPEVATPPIAAEASTALESEQEASRPVAATVEATASAPKTVRPVVKRPALSKTSLPKPAPPPAARVEPTPNVTKPPPPPPGRVADELPPELR